jgi:hypothetical protein
MRFTNVKIIPYFCNMELADFILAHEADDLGKLALARDRYVGEVEDFDLALTTLEVRRKLREKVPQWYAVPSLRYPLRISGEQCSSSETAKYKASVAHATAGGRIADLTGGLGVDSWAFAQVFDQVLYNEMRPELADAARRNFAALGLDNVRVSCAELVAERHPVKPGVTVSSCPCPPSSSCPSPPSSSCPSPIGHLLGDFQPDILFLDPARRASDGRKVFRLEDCQPDVLQLLPELLAACPLVLLKLSPMADISLVCKQLGCVKAVHVVGAEGECKELLLLLERGYAGPYTLTVYSNGAEAEIVPAAMRGETPDQVGGDVCFIPGETPDQVGGDAASWLFEPGKALLKAGAFDWPCRFGLQKLGQHTHAYVSAEPVEELRPFGKWYRLLEVVPLNNRSIKEIGKKYPRAEVTARNLPLTSEQLRAKLGVKSGGEVHVFGLHSDSLSANYLFICAGR